MEKKMNKKIIDQILILTACNIVTYGLFFIYRVFISRQIGSVGMGLYTFGMTMYYLFYNISSGGILTSVAKNIAEYYIQLDSAKKVVFVISRILLFWSITISILFFMLNPVLCNDVFNTPMLKQAIYPLIICVVIVSQSAILKGFFYGLQKPAPPAIAEVFENIMRLSIICPIFFLFSHMEFQAKLILSFVGILIGEISSYSFLLIYYKITCGKFAIALKIKEISDISKNIFQISIPLAIIGISGMIFQSLENIIIPKLFVYTGMSPQKAISVYGIINGMSFPAATLPLVVINSLATIIIPTISEIRHSETGLSNRINHFINATIIISLPITCIFMIYSTEVCEIVFKNNLAGYYLKHIAPAIVFYYLSVTLSSILNALSEVVFNFIQNTIISIIRLILYIIFIAAFKNELWYIWLTNISAIITCIIMIEKISKSKIKFQFDKTIINNLAILSFICLVLIIFLFAFGLRDFKSFCILFLSLYSIAFAFLYFRSKKV